MVGAIGAVFAADVSKAPAKNIVVFYPGVRAWNGY